MTEGIAPTPTERAVGALGARLWWTAPLATGLLAAALAEISIDRSSIQVGEAERLQLAARPVSAIWEAAVASDPTHLTTHLAWKPWLAVAGTSEEAVRYPSVLFVALAAAITTLLAGELLGRVAGLVAGLALATNGFVLGAALGVGSTSLALLLVTAGGYAFLRAARSGSAGWWVAYAVLWAGATTTSLAVASVVLAQAAYVALRPPPRPGRAIAAIVAVACFVAASLVVLGRSDAWALDWLPSPTARSVAGALWDACGGDPVLIAAALAGLVAVALRRVAPVGPPEAALLGLWVAAPPAAMLLVSLWRPAFSTGHLVAVVPAVAVLAGAAVASLVHRPVWAATAAAGLAAAATISVADALRRDAPADWRAAAGAVADRLQGRAVLVTPPSHAAALAYYAGGVAIASAPEGEEAWVLASSGDAAQRLVLGREAVAAPAYALLEEQPLGPALALQHWVRP